MFSIRVYPQTTNGRAGLTPYHATSTSLEAHIYLTRIVRIEKVMIYLKLYVEKEFKG